MKTSETNIHPMVKQNRNLGKDKTYVVLILGCSFFLLYSSSFFFLCFPFISLLPIFVFFELQEISLPF